MLVERFADTERAIQFNPELFDDDDLEYLDAIAIHPDLPIQLRAPIGVMVASERRRRDSSEPIEATFCSLNIIGLGRRELADTLGGAFTLTFSMSTLPERVESFVKLVVTQVVGLAEARLELGWKVN